MQQPQQPQSNNINSFTRMLNSPLVFHSIREHQQNISGQVSGFWPLRGEEVQRNPLSFENEDLFSETSIL